MGIRFFLHCYFPYISALSESEKNIFASMKTENDDTLVNR